jgi:uncharacterized protein YlbG (UPF0298 family)
MEELIKKYEEAKEVANNLYREILNTPDGFLYFTQLRRYGSVYWQNHKNEFSVQELCYEYDGEEGIVDVYTNNTNHNISNYGNVNFMTEQEIIDISKENVSMTSAITDWMGRGLLN